MVIANAEMVQNSPVSKHEEKHRRKEKEGNRERGQRKEEGKRESGRQTETKSDRDKGRKAIHTQREKALKTLLVKLFYCSCVYSVRALVQIKVSF